MTPNTPSPRTSTLLFVAGPLRSGSTLMRLMIDRHSRMVCPGEFDFLFDALATDGGLAAAQKMTPHQLDDFLSDDRGYLSLDKRVKDAGSTPERLRELVDRYGEGADCLALCIHRNFVSAHEIFPQARFVHLLRDPRDCAKSSVNIGFAGNVYHGLDPWLDSEESWDRLKPRLKPEQFIEIRYEELVARPDVVLTQVCQFVGLDYEPQMLDLSGTTYESPSPRYANQWRRNMDRREIELIEARVGDLMEARGYLRAGTHQRRLGGPTLMKLALQNAVRHHQEGIRLYGGSLWVQEILARRLGLRAWSRAVRLRMIPIKNTTLK